MLERLQDLARSGTLAESILESQFNGAFGETPQLIIGPKNFRFHARHHAGHSLLADFRKGFLAEIEEGEIGPITEEQKLEMIVPHAEVALEGFLVDVEEVVVGGDAASSTDVLQGFELRQRELRQCF